MVTRMLLSFLMVPVESYGPMVRNVPIKETLMLIMCFRESNEKNKIHKRQIGQYSQLPLYRSPRDLYNLLDITEFRGCYING